jgi:hypothetical protein
MFEQTDTYGVIITNFTQERRRAPYEELPHGDLDPYGWSSLADPDHAETVDERNRTPRPSKRDTRERSGLKTHGCRIAVIPNMEKI